MPPTDLDPSEPERAAPARLVRSYTLTAGRTRATVDLPVEATLRCRDDVAPVAGDSPRDRILRVCDAHSVAEVSALAELPIGVARVLLGDLVEAGLVRVEATLNDTSSRDERRDLIERTLRGLRAL